MLIKSPRDFPHHIVTGKTNHWKATNWCEENFGPRWEAIGNRKGRWCVFWKGRSVPGSYDWYFVDEKDYLLFVLKWTE